MNFRSTRHLRFSMYFFLAAVLMILIASRFTVFRVEEQSMVPTLADGQWILVKKSPREVEPGDLVVFRSPADGELAVKRCILSGGEHPEVDHGWLVTPWGRWFLTGRQWDQLDKLDTIPPDSVYLVGDNQFHSMDSRHYGTVARSELVGRVLMPRGRRENG